MQQASDSRRLRKKVSRIGKPGAPTAGGTKRAGDWQPGTVPQLEAVLEGWRSDATALRRHGHEDAATVLECRIDEVTGSAREYLDWISESEAMLRSGKAKRWLRTRFAEWELAGHARVRGGHRQYRMIIVPCRRAVVNAYEEGRRAAQEAA